MSKIEYNEHWFHQMPGKMLFQMEQNMLHSFISQVKGHCLIQMGGPNNISIAPGSPILHQYYMGMSVHENNPVSIMANFSELPFLNNQMDVAILVHILEFISNPTQALIQLKDQLNANGYLIIFGFNFWSLWSLIKLYKSNEFPWNGRFLGVLTLKRWLRALDFHIITTRTGCFRFPTREERVAKKVLVMEPMGQFFFPGLGAFYMIIAQKRVYALDMNKEKIWSKKYSVANHCPKPTARNM